MSARKALPKYCHHKATGQAYVRLDGRMHYLGRYDSPESWDEYDRQIEEWRRRIDPDRRPAISIGELILSYGDHARSYYRKSGKLTSEVACIDAACRFLTPHRHRRAADFGPLLLQEIRLDMVNAGLARSTVNAQVGRLRRMFRWAVAQQLVKPDVLVALEAVAPLRAGRCEARETDPIEPVDDELVDATLPMLSESLQAVVKVLRLTGARTGEILSMRVGDLDRTGDVWIYRPRSHKTEHKGKRRVILLGPQAQSIILPLLRADASAYVFRPGSAGRERYHAQAVRKAVTRAIDRLNKRRADDELPPLPHWHPHQLRHSAATRLRREAGFDNAKTILGHAKAEMTELYAERDLEAARRAVLQLG